MPTSQNFETMEKHSPSRISGRFDLMIRSDRRQSTSSGESIEEMVGEVVGLGFARAVEQRARIVE